LLRQPRNATKCRVERFVTGQGEHAVRKVPRGTVWTRWISSFLLRREAHFVNRLQHLPCIPRVLETRADVLIVEYVPGRTLTDARAEGVAKPVADAVVRAVRALHAAGVAHGALGRRDILLADDGRVLILDLATAVSAVHPPLLGRWLLPWLQRRDRARVGRALAMLRARWEQRAHAEPCQDEPRRMEPEPKRS